MSSPRGRYAPSPTGEMHLGNASSALLAWLSIRARDGSFVMRMEDLDRNRVRTGLDVQILEDLTWMGIDWDEGPDRGGPFAPYAQWARLDRYAEAFERLRAAGRVYPCFCSRKEIASAVSAPQSPGDELRYPGNCRELDPADSARRIQAGERHAWRFWVEPDQRPVFHDMVGGAWGEGRKESPGDFIVYRADGVPAYQLAVVVDDSGMGITEVVRGDDLLPSTARQLLLYDALGQARPTFGHVPLLLGPDGVRLSKRHQGTTLREMREAGFSAGQIVGRLAHAVGLRPDPGPLRAVELIDGFDLEQIEARRSGIRIDPSRWEAV